MHAASAAWTGLSTAKEEAEDAFYNAKGPAARELDDFIRSQEDALEEAFTEKNDAAMEVYKYLTDNYTRYLNELLGHIFEGATEDDRDDLIATALKADLKDAFLADVVDLNGQLLAQMTKKMAKVRKSL